MHRNEWSRSSECANQTPLLIITGVAGRDQQSGHRTELVHVGRYHRILVAVGFRSSSCGPLLHVGRVRSVPSFGGAGDLARPQLDNLRPTTATLT